MTTNLLNIVFDITTIVALIIAVIVILFKVIIIIANDILKLIELHNIKSV